MSASHAKDIAAALSPPGGGVAPTPQNTPAAHTLSASVMSRPQVPSTLSEEVEGEEDDGVETLQSAGVTGAGAGAGASGANNALAGLASNPAFASLVQNRLTSLVGRSSGYVESLPLPIQRRIIALKGVQSQHSVIEAEFQKDIFELEKKYVEKYKPLYERRKQIILGGNEPTDEEMVRGEKEEDEEFEDEQDSDEEEEEEDEEVEEAKPKTREHLAVPSSAELAAAPKGIPEFWLTALKNHLGLSELITERDEEALKYLIDIRLSYPTDKPGFKLTFEFSKEISSFFTNKDGLLEKTYYYQDEVGYEGDFVYDHAVGTKISWVDGKDLTVRIETKKQRNKNTNQTRIVKKVVPTDSFFSFFTPPKPPSGEADEDEEDAEDDDIDEKLELDYQIGEDLKERVIPRAIDFFTGKALRYESGFNGGMGDSDFEDEFEDDEDEDDSDEDGTGRSGGPRKALAPPSGVTPASHQDPQECKQS